MASFNTPLQLTPQPQRILDKYLTRQYLAQMLNVPQVPTLHQAVGPRDHTHGLPSVLPTTTSSGVNRRRIFKQKCRRYVPPRSISETNKEVDISPIPEVVCPFDANVSNTISQAAVTPQVTFEPKSYPQTPTVYRNILEPPIIFMSPNIRDKERSSLTTSTPNNVGRRHIFKKRCNRYVPEEMMLQERIEVLNPVNTKKYKEAVKPKTVSDCINVKKIMPPLIKVKSFASLNMELAWQNTTNSDNKAKGTVKQKIKESKIPTTVDHKFREDKFHDKVEDIINDTCEKIFMGATTRTIAHLNNEFEKLMQRLRQNGFNDIEDKQGSNEKATSPNTAIPDLPEPAKIKYPVETVRAKVKREKFKKSHFEGLKPLNRQKCSNDEKVPIGMGYARVSARLLKSMNWKSYSYCTRKLMAAVFPRRILATHSLTGKASPAFPDKPAKKMLDPMLINDIIITVMDKCGVSESQVRVCVTTKCADESKMLRTIEQKIKYNRRGNQKENYLPSSGSEDDSSVSASD